MSKTADVSLDKAAFLGLWLEAVMYGCHVTAFLFSLYLLRKSESRTKKFNPVIVFLVLLALFVLSTTHISINLARGIVAFVSFQGSPYGASTYLQRLWAPSNVAKQAAYVTNILISDYFALYRLYIMISQIRTQQYLKPTASRWPNLTSIPTLLSYCKPSTFIIALPTCSLLASAVCGYKSVYNVSQRLPGEDAFMPAVSSLRVSLLVLSLVTNALVTVIIVVFIAYHSRIQTLDCSDWDQIGLPGGSPAQHNYRKACLSSLLQFGIVIPLSLITLIVLYSLKMNANYIVFDSMTQIGGLFATVLVIHEQLFNICNQMNATATARALDRQTVRKQRSNESNLGGRISPLKPPIEIKVRVDVNTEQSHDKSDYKSDFGYQSGSQPVATAKSEREAGDFKLNLDDPEQGSDLGLPDNQNLPHDDDEGQNSESADDSGSEDSLVEKRGES